MHRFEELHYSVISFLSASLWLFPSVKPGLFHLVFFCRWAIAPVCVCRTSETNWHAFAGKCSILTRTCSCDYRLACVQQWVMGCWWTQTGSWHYPALWLRERVEVVEGCRCPFRSNGPSIQSFNWVSFICLFYSPFLPLRFLRSSIFFFILPPSRLQTLLRVVVCKNARLQSEWPSPVVFLSTSDRFWGNSVMASCTFRFKSIPRIQKIGFLFFSLTYFPLCPSLSFSQCHLCLPLALSLCPSPSPSALFIHTIIERYFPSSPGLSVLAHKGTKMTCTFRTISRRTFRISMQRIPFQSRTSPIRE